MKKLLYGLVLAGGALFGFAARADVSVSWTSPADGATYAVGARVTPVGQASASGVIGGTGLDLALVIDTSGSMSGSRLNAAKAAATALVNALPDATTSVTVIEQRQARCRACLSS